MSITTVTLIVIIISMVIDIIMRSNYRDLYKGLGYNANKLMLSQALLYVVNFGLLLISNHTFQVVYLVLCLVGLVYQLVHHFIITPMVMKRING